MLVFSLGSGRLRKPNDQPGAAVAMSIVNDGPARDRIVRGAYLSSDPRDSLGCVTNVSPGQRDDLHEAIGKRDPDDLDGVALLMCQPRSELVDWAVAEKILDEEDKEPLPETLTALYDVIRVDAFDAQGIKEISA
ncbi:MAG: acyl-CoA dehydrogenase [Candidatus Azotimanducaceae bacterium]